MGRTGISEERKVTIIDDYADPSSDTHHSMKKVAVKNQVHHTTVKRILLERDIEIAGRGRVAVVDKPIFRKLTKDKRKEAVINDYIDARTNTYHNIPKTADKNKISYTTVKNILLQNNIPLFDGRCKLQIIVKKKVKGRRKEKREKKRYDIFPLNHQNSSIKE